MAKVFRIQGMSDLQERLRLAPQRLKVFAAAEIETGAQEWVSAAVIDAPGDVGGLRQSITYEKIGETLFQIVAQKFYAPFMEFGTKGNYRPIPGTEEIAAEFQGLKGEGDLFDNILAWVIRKQIGGDNPRQVAFLIARSIFKFGVKAHPFFFKQAEIVFPAIINRLRSTLERELKVAVLAPSSNQIRYITI